MTPAIQCKYSCFRCGIYRRTVTIPQRTDSQDVLYWMEHVCAPALSRDHDVQSPGCQITELSEVMIPAPEGTERIGTSPPGSPDAQVACHVCGKPLDKSDVVFKGSDGVYRDRLKALPGDRAICMDCVVASGKGVTRA